MVPLELIENCVCSTTEPLANDDIFTFIWIHCGEGAKIHFMLQQVKPGFTISTNRIKVILGNLQNRREREK